MSFPVGSKWLIKRVGVPEQKIQVTSSSGEKFSAKYFELDNPSEFAGEIWVREAQVINIKQHDRSTGYVAFQTGLRQVKDDKYEGS